MKFFYFTSEPTSELDRLSLLDDLCFDALLLMTPIVSDNFSGFYLFILDFINVIINFICKKV